MVVQHLELQKTWEFKINTHLFMGVNSISKVAEAINNCLQHGKFIGSEKIQLYISWYDDKLVIELNNPISDELNIELRFSTHLPVNLFQERGRGFYLMNKYMDDVTLTKKNNRLHVVMEVKFSKSDEKNNASE